MAAPSATAVPLTSVAPAGWLGSGSDPVGLLAALDAKRDKLPPEFDARLRHRLPDGTLRVMVSTTRRDAAVERFVRDTTTLAQWYSDLPAFFGTVTPDQLERLVRSPHVRFVEPDHPISYSLSASVVDTKARVPVPGSPPAATANGAVSRTSPSVSWTANGKGGIVHDVNYTLDRVGLRQLCEAPSCDTFRLNVADAGDLAVTTGDGGRYVTMSVEKPDGSTVTSPATDSVTARVVIRAAARGTYVVRTWTNRIPGLTYPSYTVTANLTFPDGDAPRGLWGYDASGGGLGRLASADPTLDTGSATGAGVGVAIVDSGIDQTHPDFGGFSCEATPLQPCQSRIKSRVAVVPNGLGTEHVASAELGAAPTTELVSGHGTHVAGIVAGNGYMARNAARSGGGPGAAAGVDRKLEIPIGVAPQASLVSIKNGDSQSAALSVNGLAWLRDNAARLGVRVVNNSWGCDGCSISGSSATAMIYKALYEKGVLVVFATGNKGSDNTLSGYAQSPYVLGVANYDHSSQRLNSSSSQGNDNTLASNVATWTPGSEPADGYRRPDIAAPGTNIYAARTLTGGTSSLAPRVDGGNAGGATSGGTSGYVGMTGTSMAAPHVAGAAAVLFSACPSATVLDVMRAMKASAHRTRILQPSAPGTAPPLDPAPPKAVGYGALDVRGALDWMRANVKACKLPIPPTPVLDGPSEVMLGQTARFDGSASSDPNGTIASYHWDLGDGTTATTPVVDHVYDEAGTYTVSLTVTDDTGLSATASREIDVILPPNETPKPDFAGVAEATATEPAAFDASASSDDGTIVTYAWDFGDGATGEGVRVEHAWARSGTYPVTLTVTDDRGASATVSRSVTVHNAAPTAAFTAPAEVSAEDAAAFDGSASADRDGSLVSHKWSFGDGGTASGPGASHTFLWAGDYQVRLTVTDDEGATAVSERLVTVTDEPASGQKRLTATGLTRHKCDASRWTFSVSRAADAPGTIAVVWADGSRERVARSSTKGKTALYDTSASLDQIATRAWADVPSASTATFELASGPCH